MSLNVQDTARARNKHIAFGNLSNKDTTPSGLTTTTMQWAILPEPWRPHLGQKKAVKFLLEHAAGGLFATPGTGKTSAVYAAFKVLKKRCLANKMLVIAPLRPVSLVWPLEAKKWIDFRDLRVEILHGKDKEKALLRDADVYVINYEGLAWLFDIQVHRSPTGKKSVTINAAKFQKYGFDTLVVDELSRVKHPQSITFKTLKPALQFFSRRWGLTGSPAPNGLTDLFGQCYIMDMGRTFGQYITHFRNQYCNPSKDGFGWVVREGADKEIYNRIKPLVLRLAAEDYVDMPDLVPRRIMFDLPPEVRQTYDEMEEDMFSRLAAGEVVAANAAAASSKCRQIANGGVYLEDQDERKWSNLHTMKVDLLHDLYEELQGEPILVAYEFNHDLDRLLIRFGKNTPYIGGGVSTRRAAEIEGAWNRGEIPLLLGHPKSIGHGLNLQASGFHVCWHSMIWDLEMYQQFTGRVHRQGQKAKRVFVHHIMASKTLDETIWYTLQQKDKTQNALFEALKGRRR